ncbi:hypothetical protein BH11BAC2_BH11BAC2_04230 [soil metagenome]
MAGNFFFGLSLIFFSSCVHNSDLTNIREIKYEQDIRPILSANCNYSGCHGGSDGEFSLASYQDVISNGDIKAGDARGSKLYKSITRRGLIQQMPPSGSTQLIDNDIQLIYIWIEQGAKNN